MLYNLNIINLTDPQLTHPSPHLILQHSSPLLPPHSPFNISTLHHHNHLFTATPQPPPPHAFTTTTLTPTTLHRDAAMMAMRRRIQGLTPDMIRKIPKHELDLPTTADDFQVAIKKVSKSVSNDDIAQFMKWMEEFGSV